jgi:hypothetical protein
MVGGWGNEIMNDQTGFVVGGLVTFFSFSFLVFERRGCIGERRMLIVGSMIVVATLDLTVFHPAFYFRGMLGGKEGKGSELDLEGVSGGYVTLTKEGGKVREGEK